jgi:RNA polymerase sigma-70 factor (ECF subfamily)
VTHVTPTGPRPRPPSSARADDFDAFFCEHYDRLVRSVTVLTGDPHEAADAVQDAFVRAYARWSRLRRYDAPEAWVRKVAINRTRDTWRSRRRRERREERVAGREAAGPDATALVDSGLALAAVLADLPHRQRAVAALHYVDDLSVAEIAESLGISQGTVKFHLNRARAALAPGFDVGDDA